MRRVPIALLLALVGCHHPPPARVDAGPPPVITQDILVRPVQTRQAEVQHILIGWGELASAYRGPMDPRAAQRDEPAAEDLVRTVFARARAGEPFEALMREYSEDVVNARVGGTYDVAPDGKMEPEFQALSLRLQVGEIGVCRSDYGYHIIKRVK